MVSSALYTGTYQVSISIGLYSVSMDLRKVEENMVLYFTGTGNSRYFARLVADHIQDECVSLNERIKKNDTTSLYSDKAYVLVCPTYAWRIPRLVEPYLRTVALQGSKKIYFILTCGAETAAAVNYVKNLSTKIAMEFMGFAEIKMPENYIAMFSVPSTEEIEQQMRIATTRAIELATHIKEEQPFSIFEPIQKWKSGVMNLLFYALSVQSKGFFATDKCIGCNKCAVLCPLNNIQLVDNKPKWGKHCTHCMACIGACPTQAIEYRKKTQGKQRYYLP